MKFSILSPDLIQHYNLTGGVKQFSIVCIVNTKTKFKMDHGFDIVLVTPKHSWTISTAVIEWIAYRHGLS